jgi:antitoxin component of RelBE/YafQ-DinJ toxin-antitoxin module
MRVNTELRDKFQEFCEKKGLSVNCVIRMYIRDCVRRQALSLDFFDREIGIPDKKTARGAYSIDRDMRDNFCALCKTYGVTMSIAVRDFMNSCVRYNRFPSSSR